MDEWRMLVVCPGIYSTTYILYVVYYIYIISYVVYILSSIHSIKQIGIRRIFRVKLNLNERTNKKNNKTKIVSLEKSHLCKRYEGLTYVSSHCIMCIFHFFTKDKMNRNSRKVSVLKIITEKIYKNL